MFDSVLVNVQTITLLIMTKQKIGKYSDIGMICKSTAVELCPQLVLHLVPSLDVFHFCACAAAV